MFREDGLVIFTGVVTDFTKFVSVEVGAPIIGCTVGPVLSVPVIGGAIDLRSLWDRSIGEFFPLFVLCDYFVDRGECVVECVLGSWLEYV